MKKEDKGEVEEEEAERSIGAYYRLLRDYPGFRILWIGEILGQTGNWFNYIATLTVVSRLADGRGLPISIVLIIHFLPSFIWFPVAGVVADRFNRVKVLIGSCIVSSVTVALLPVITNASQLWLMYVLLFINFSTSAFYEPARRAITPSLVPRKALHLATTLDAFAWSLTGAFGSSLGGLATSQIGTAACFWLDAVTYVVAGFCAFLLLGIQTEKGKEARSSGEVATAEGGGTLPSSVLERGAMGVELGEVVSVGPGVSLGESMNTAGGGSAVERLRAGGPLAAALEDDSGSGMAQDSAAEEESAALLGGENEDRDASAPEGCLPLLLWSMRDEVAALKEGFVYACQPVNRDVLAYTLMKASGTLIWGAADILNVRFSEMKEMQAFGGDSAFTLGLFFASVGFACFVGPVVFNILTPPKPAQLMLSSGVCYSFLAFGYLGMAASWSILPMCLSIACRSFGSAVLWVYSTLLLQLRVPDSLLGRMLALEVAFYTVGECSSVLAAGWALDHGGVTIRQLCLVLALLGGLMTAGWLPYAIVKYRSLQPAKHLSAV